LGRTTLPEYELCAPWYVRAALPPGSPEIHRPVIQMYDQANLVPGLLRSPSDSLAFRVSRDVWSYFRPDDTDRKAPIRSDQRALFAPTKQRFYAVCAELSLKWSGFRGAGAARDVEVRLVVRRERMTLPSFTPRQSERAKRFFFRVLRPLNPSASGLDTLTETDVRDFMAADLLIAPGLRAEYRCLLTGMDVWRQAQAITVDADGRAAWSELDGDFQDGLAPDEQEQPMWRVPAPATGTPAEQERSLWFGLVPTGVPFLNAPDPATADHRWTYAVRCLAHRPAPHDHPFCPAATWLSEPTIPFRLAPPDVAPFPA
jgi:hypothetical protein